MFSKLGAQHRRAVVALNEEIGYLGADKGRNDQCHRVQRVQIQRQALAVAGDRIVFVMGVPLWDVTICTSCPSFYNDSTIAVSISG